MSELVCAGALLALFVTGLYYTRKAQREIERLTGLLKGLIDAKDAIEAAMREKDEELDFLRSVKESRGRELDAKDAEIQRLTERVESAADGLLERDAEIERLKEALEFYADPETYFGIAVIGDPPCGAFVGDLSDDHGHPYLDGPRYGKVARAVLNTEKPK